MTRVIRAFYLTLFVLGSSSLLGVGGMIELGIAREYQYVSTVLFSSGILSVMGGFFAVSIERAMRAR